MKPAELYFEPVLIGLATLFVAAMMGSRELEAWLLHADIGELAIAIAAAYFVGIVVDRTADAILDPLNHHHRLQVAMKELRGRNVEDRSDPFPEDAYHIATTESEQASEYVYYLRSRIRLTRAMLVLAPACAVGVALRFSDASASTQHVAVALVYAIYGIALLNRCREVKQATATLLAVPHANLGPPRTRDLVDTSVLE